MFSKTSSLKINASNMAIVIDTHCVNRNCELPEVVWCHVNINMM